MKQPRLNYEGEFFGVNGTRWRVEIWKESEYSPGVEELRFPGQDALEIVWNETDKLETVCSSAATLTLISQTDRQYVGLYTVDAGSIRMDVYRNEEFYWSGTLDTELYSEPFSYESEYEVELTFSDFAMLERINFSGSGYQTLRGLIDGAMGTSRIRRGSFTEHISTARADKPAANLLDSVSINCGNFYDEEGMPMTVRAMLEEVLRPFALHVMQKAGAIHVYDFNKLRTLYESGSKEIQTIEWDSNDAELSVDRVYKNVKVTFSPYEKSELIHAQVSVKGLSIAHPNLMVRKDYSADNQGNLTSAVGFFVDVYHEKAQLKGITLGNKARPFKIRSIFSGSDHEGVASILRIAYNGISAYTTYADTGLNVDGSVLMKMNQSVFVPNVAYAGNSPDSYDVQLRIRLDMMLDVRYNPFEEATPQNESGDYGRFRDNESAVLIPFRLRIRGGNGIVSHHYTNIDATNKSKVLVIANGWPQGDYNPSGSSPYALLAFYDPDQANSGNNKPYYTGGWKSCKQCLPTFTYNAAKKYMDMGDGQYIPIPEGVSGTLEMEVLKGAYFRSGHNYFDANIAISHQMHALTDDKVRWLLLKAPLLDLVDMYGREINTDDIECTSWINSAAKEELNIDTICGCGNNTQKRGYGLLLRTEDYKPIGSFTRGGVTDFVEKLLIGTVYSNYATRNNVLSGTTVLASTFSLYTDRAEPGYYFPLGEVQNLQDENSDMTLVQIEADNYEGIDYNKIV